MKNFLLIILGGLIGFVICYFICYDGANFTDEPVITKPSGIISPSEAKELDQAFNSRHELISDSIVKRPDNRSSWYSLKDLKAYLVYAEKQADSSGYTMDGVRLYLGAYPDVGNEVGYTTIFFIPTGYEAISKGSTLPTTQGGAKDLINSDGLDLGQSGFPPDSNYPQ